MQIEVASDVSGSPPPARVRALLTRAARLVPKSEIRNSKSEITSVLFCGDKRMRALNRRWRGMDRSTNVLAFPGTGSGLLGDIAVCVPYAAREARRRRETSAREIDRLLVHGFLHLSGYDHETDDGEMDALEARLRQRLGLAEKAR